MNSIMEMTCPECGGHCKILDIRTNEEGSPLNVSLECPECGKFAVSAGPTPTSLWRVDGSGLVYNPWAKTNTLTFVERFDETAFDTAQAAILCNIDLLNTCFGDCIAAGMMDGARELKDRMKVVLEKGIGMGLKVQSHYAILLMSDIPSAEGEDLKKIIKQISDLIAESDVVNLASTISALSRMIVKFSYMAEPLNDAVARIEKLLAEEKGKLEIYVDDASAAVRGFNGAGMPDKAMDVSEGLFAYMKGLPADTEGLEDYMVTACLCVMDSPCEGQTLDDAIAYLEKVGDSNRAVFAVSVVKYCAARWNSVGVERITELLSAAIEYGKKDGMAARIMYTLYALRFKAAHDPKDAYAAAKNAFDVMDEDPSAADAIAYVLRDPKTPGQHRAEILRELKKRGLTEKDMTDRNVPQ